MDAQRSPAAPRLSLLHPCRAQDGHRQRTVDWINAAGGLSTAFDITTKGIMHAVFERTEYWRLRDDKGKPPGLLGWWPSRAVTFLENHDTVSVPAQPLLGCHT